MIAFAVGDFEIKLYFESIDSIVAAVFSSFLVIRSIQMLLKRHYSLCADVPVLHTEYHKQKERTDFDRLFPRHSLSFPVNSFTANVQQCSSGLVTD